MFKVELEQRKLVKLSGTGLVSENLLERQDFQQFIFNSWECFKNDIGLPSAMLLGQEIKPHDSVGNQIDLLAYDQNDSSLIVIELKRDKNKLQLLQALSYASMVATWDAEKLIYHMNFSEQTDETKELIENIEINKRVKIVLIAESFDPEVIICADWLVSCYGLDISIFSVELNKINHEIFLDVDQKYPLKELSETYVARRIDSSVLKLKKTTNWEEVVAKLNYDFAQEAVDLCKLIKGDGDPKRRRFGDITRSKPPFKWISFNFRVKYLNIYTGCVDKIHAAKIIHDLLGNHVEVIEWAGGISFNISDKQSFEKVKNWFDLG